jgi:type VI protein secretion system component VasF
MAALSQMEHQIAQQLLQRRAADSEGLAGVQQCEGQRASAAADLTPWADRLIGILAVTTGLLLVGSHLEELLWAAVAATTVITLR